MQRACVKLHMSFDSYVSLELFVWLFVCLLLRVENSQVVSLRELESMDAILVATFIAVNLRSMSR